MHQYVYMKKWNIWFCMKTTIVLLHTKNGFVKWKNLNGWRDGLGRKGRAEKKRIALINVVGSRVRVQFSVWFFSFWRSKRKTIDCTSNKIIIDYIFCRQLFLYLSFLIWNIFLFYFLDVPRNKATTYRCPFFISSSF